MTFGMYNCLYSRLLPDLKAVSPPEQGYLSFEFHFSQSICCSLEWQIRCLYLYLFMLTAGFEGLLPDLKAVGPPEQGYLSFELNFSQSICHSLEWQSRCLHLYLFMLTAGSEGGRPKAIFVLSFLFLKAFVIYWSDKIDPFTCLKCPNPGLLPDCVEPPVLVSSCQRKGLDSGSPGCFPQVQPRPVFLGDT